MFVPFAQPRGPRESAHPCASCSPCCPPCEIVRAQSCVFLLTHPGASRFRCAFQSALRCSPHQAPPRAACGSQVWARIPPGSLCARRFVQIPETSWKDNPPTRRRLERRVCPRPGAILHCRTGHRGLKLTSDELGGQGSVFRAPHKRECLIVRRVKHCGIQFPHDLCVARPHTELPP